MPRHTLLLTSLIVALAAGCSRSKADRADASRDPEPAAKSGERAHTVTGVRVDPELRTACGLAEVETFFEYDSTELDPPQDTALYRLAHCLADGKAKGRHVRVVGHTDPTGSDRYNDELGKSRAQAVREYLVLHGVAHEQIETLSMGEAGADEKSPAEWPYDRRVDIRLAPASPTPAP
jgi:outer membrane protein OmpA-like peptidoglycan-associated protein